jgi:hypothetical protein
MSAGNSRTSGEKSQLSGTSTNSLATAHARLDGIEAAVLNIQTLLTTMSVDHHQSIAPPLSPSKAWPSMPRKQLFSNAEPDNQLVLLSTGQSPAAAQKASKRRKAPSSPSDLIPQYTEQMDSGGEESF